MNFKSFILYSGLVLVLLLTWLIPMPIFSIIWLDVVIILGFFFRTHHSIIIVAIVLVLCVLGLHIFEYIDSAERLTHYAFLWSIIGVLKFISLQGKLPEKKKHIETEGEILGKFMYTDDPVLQGVKETVLALIVTVSFVMIDMFLNPEWWG